MVEFQNSSIKIKNCKIFYEAQTVSCLKEIIQPPPNTQPIPHQIKSYYVFGTKIFLRKYTEIYRHLILKCFKNAVLWRQEMMQPKCFFLTPNRNMYPGRLVKSKRFLTVLREHIIFNVKWFEARTKSEVFWAKLYC